MTEQKIKHLTEYEKKAYAASNLLPEPGNEVARELLGTIDELRASNADLNKVVDLMAAAIRRQSIKWGKQVTKLNSDQADDTVMSESSIREMYEKEARA